MLDAYTVFPATDIPMHFAGGLSIAFFVSGCFRALPREALAGSRRVVLELVLLGSLTATAAVVWEFAELACDRAFGAGFQMSLANTMQDLAMGLLGAGVYMVRRALVLRAGPADFRAVLLEVR
jgi:hypothetical protein